MEKVEKRKEEEEEEEEEEEQRKTKEVERALKRIKTGVQSDMHLTAELERNKASEKGLS